MARHRAESLRRGPQPDAIYCPLCAAHLRPVTSNKKSINTSHHYECEHGHSWEINRIVDGTPRNWNGARPQWGRATGPEEPAAGGV